MIGWFLFVYGVPATAGMLVFLKVVADRLAWIEAAAGIAQHEAAAEEARTLAGDG